MPRFFVSDEWISENKITILGDDARHIARSLRMAVGDVITACSLPGKEYECRLLKIRDDACECEILEERRGLSESPVKTALFMAYPKGDKLELVVQKAVELGASKIIPFESKRCIKRPKEDRQEKQTARLARIAEEAAKQCGRCSLPEVLPTVSFSDMLTLAKESEISLFCYEGDGCISMKEVLYNNKGCKSISIIVGSEGGFAPDEAESARRAGLTLVNLGPRILRCETAPMYALSALSYEFEL